MSLAKCPEAEVRSISLAVKSGNQVLPDKPAEIRAAGPGMAAGQLNGSGAMTVVALGPVLGSMDSQHIRLETSCGAGGIVLAATITRSADYHGAALKFALWRPEVTIDLNLLQAETSLSAIWKMRLTDGTEVTRAENSPLPTVHYPFTVKRAFHHP